ncbi:prenyltransferase/squalene oxidase repeat-containing protein [Zavarzinella formosa]|uniref:prenyltransferase/squalene oxidase repeat-containing protein n=1 Tax=Zavarzinella formosa TaxID=360055 RepID=UPI0002F7036F|nr:prenyltransferase/squalene oxidase repeat-containing protein [Zavarzinella formosa]
MTWHGSRILPILTLACLMVSRAVAESPAPEKLRAAAGKSLSLLESSAAEYTEHRDCFSCHHQAMPVLAFAVAKTRGFKMDEKSLEKQIQHTTSFLDKNRENFEKGKGTGGQADTAGYALLTLHTGGRKADATTEAVAGYLLQKDRDRGYWPTSSQRPPTEASMFTTTYLGVSALKNYGPEAKRKEIDARLEKVREWLRETKPKDTEDRVFRLRLLKLIGADEKEVKAAADDLAKAQREDGGWSQNDKLESDAYATGSVLVALHQSGSVSAKDTVYQKGLGFLLKTQEADGSWHIKSRSKPFQAYFESGFPHKKDQWISCAGTSWAAIAIMLACEP